MDPVLSRYQRDVNCLSDADRSTRSRSLVRLSDALVGRRADDAFDAPGERSRFLSESLLQPLLARLVDPVEKCREVALTLVTKLIEDDLSAAQPGFNLAPQLLDSATAELVRYAELRLGEVPFPEASEELRLAWTELFHLLLSHTGCQPALSRELSKVVKVLCKASSDSFPENKTQCAKCTVKLCERFPESIHLHLEVLIVAITANMGHQHSKVRSASLEAVKQLVLAGAATSSNFDELMRDRIVPVLRGLNYDRSSAVRKQGLYLASELLLSMPKSQSYHKDLLPILLFALADPAKQLQEESLAIIEKVGSSLLEGSSVAEGSGEPPAPPTQNEANGSTWSAHLPEPFEARPGHGARQLVVQTMPSALPVVLREAMDWTAQERFRAVALARSILVFAEENIAPFVKDVLNMLYVTCLDDELVIREASMDCARLMGQFVTPEKLLKEVAATFSGMNPNRPEETVSARIGGLAVLSAAVLGLPSTPQLVEHLCTCVGIVISSSLCESESEEVQRYVLQIIQGILDRFLTEKGSRAGDLVLDSVTVCKLLYVLLILVTSEEKEGDFGSETENSIALLAGCAGYLQPHGAPDTKALIVACASTLLRASVTNSLNTLESAAESDITDDLVAACTSWNKFDGRRRVFDQVSRRAGAEGLEQAGCTLLVVRVLCATSSVELDADLRLCMLSLLESLVSSHAAAMEQESRSPLDQHLATIVSDVLMPNLVWRAGRVANTIRKVSVFCFSRFVGVSEAQANWFQREFDTISPPLKACLDDMEPDTRRFACQAFRHIFSLFARHEKMLEPLQVSNLYHDIIKRLDDADDTVRIVACGALEEMVRVAPASILTGTVVEYITDMSFIHLDDPKTEVQQAVFDLLSQVIRSGTDAETVFTKASNQRGQHRSPQWCDRLIALKGN